MKNITTHTGRLVDIQRMKSSVNGNPRYSFTLVEDSLENRVQGCISVDSSFGYSLPNYLNKRVTIKVGLHRNKITLADIEKA